MPRQSLSKKLRFEVFEQNNFTCQYCGRSPQNQSITLQVDHIISVKNGGTNDRNNLITSCWDCNIGKGKKTTLLPNIPDKALELELVQDRLAQVIAINKYQEKINKAKAKVVKHQYKQIDDLTKNYIDSLKNKIYKIYNKHENIVPMDVFCECLEITNNKNIKLSEDYLKYFQGVLKVKKFLLENPEFVESSQCYVVARKCFGWKADRAIIKDIYDRYEPEYIYECLEDAYSWNGFLNKFDF